MKKLIAIAAIILTGLVAFPEKAEAGHTTYTVTYVNGRTSCGCPIHVTRYFKGYDCHRRPIYSYRQHPVSHRCSHHAQRSHRSHYVPSRSNCRPTPHVSHRSHYSRSQYYRPSRGYSSHYRGGCR
jgi:hypothetical protein